MSVLFIRCMYASNVLISTGVQLPRKKGLFYAAYRKNAILLKMLVAAHVAEGTISADVLSLDVVHTFKVNASGKAAVVFVYRVP